MVTQATHPGSTRKEFFKLLARLEGSEPLNISSVARTLGVTDGLLSRYMREARQAGWVETKKTWWGTVVTVLDRDSLLRASGEARPEGGSVGDGQSSDGKA